MSWQVRKITVNIQQGIHGRVASRLAALAGEHDAVLLIENEDHDIDCTSILDVLSMAFVYGSSLTFKARGKDAVKLLDKVGDLLESSEDPAS